LTGLRLETFPIGVSAGTASVLGLRKIRLMEEPTTAHFLFGEDCVNQCAFCAQARGSKASPDHLSRVTWPRFSWETLKGPMESAITRGVFKRVCVQTVECSDSQGPAFEFLEEIRKMSSEVFISVAVAPVSVSRVKLFFDKGATNVGLPIDAASPEVYERVKGGSFERAWTVVEEAAKTWPGRVSTHLIVGLGETEEDAVKFLLRARSAGITVGLFAFTPVRGTAMEKAPPPDVGHYRRVQLAAYFLKRGGDAGKIELRDGRIVGIVLDREDLKAEVLSGRPFETSGCLYCNRPYYNERPGQVMMNYPRTLTEEEAARALRESGLF